MIGLLLSGVAAVVFLPVASAPSPLADPITQGELVSIAADGSVIPVPLKHTEVEAEVTGLVAHVRVTQTFENPFDRPIEAIYLFPLPNHAAVDAMEIRLDDRVIRGGIRKREEARALYAEARRAGKTAALLDQKRPNIFTQSVANILPGGSIPVHLRYFETLPDRSGDQEFVFPMVVGPRFIPGTPTAQTGSECLPDTTDVHDASRITPPALQPGERSGHDVGMEVRIATGLPATHVVSPSHRVIVDHDPAGFTRVRLANDDAIPNRDFVLRYRLDGGAPNLIVLPHRATGEGYFLALLRPEASPPPEAVAPKEMIFVVDCSGSMHGEPIAKVREAMRYALEHLDPLDNFQIIKFSSFTQAFAPEPVPATPAHIARALEYVDRLSGDGGTILIEGVAAALSYREDPQRFRIVSLMTDGYIGNEDEILAYLRGHLGSARLHSFGVGSSVNRHLIDSMAEFGGGSAEYILLHDPSGDAVRRFYDRIRHPYLTHLSIDWGGLQVSDLQPAQVPDLFLGQPILLGGRYRRPGDAVVTVRGRIGGQPYEGRFPVRLPEQEPSGEAIATLWARARIADLSDRLVSTPDAGLIEEITTTALDHHLVSAYTSFVAVEERIRNTTGAVDTVAVPVPVPEGVSPESTVGSREGATRFSSEYIDALPILGRNLQDVLMIARGDVDVDGNPPLHGARDTDVVTLVDGLSIVEPNHGSPAGALNLDSIESTGAMTGGATAEFGKAPGGFVNIVVQGKVETVESASSTVSRVVGGGLGGMIGGVAGGMIGGVDTTDGAPPSDPNPGAIEIFCFLSAPEGGFCPGEAIEVVLTVRNDSDSPIRVPDFLSVTSGNARFEIRNARGEIPDHPSEMNVSVDRPQLLMPGEERLYRLRLDGPGGYRISRPGTYFVVFLGSEIGLTDSTRLTIFVR
jgi:Ca-activated chloride channel family protein